MSDACDPPDRGPPEGAARVISAFRGEHQAQRRVEGRFRTLRLDADRRALLRLTRFLHPGPRLDLACGTGTLARVHRGVERLIGVDASAEMLALAAAQPDYSGFVQADARRLPFADGAFAAAVALRLLHHLESADRRAVLRELRRVVAGPVVISFFDSETFEAWRARARRARRGGSRRPTTVQDLREDAGIAGYRLDRVSRKWGRFSEHVHALLVPEEHPEGV